MKHTDCPILSKDLCLADIPVRLKTWNDIIEFAATFRPQDGLADHKVRGLVDITEASSIDAIRAALYCEYRRYNHFGYDPEDHVINDAKRAVELLRSKLGREQELKNSTETPKSTQYKLPCLLKVDSVLTSTARYFLYMTVAGAAGVALIWLGVHWESGFFMTVGFLLSLPFWAWSILFCLLFVLTYTSLVYWRVVDCFYPKSNNNNKRE